MWTFSYKMHTRNMFTKIRESADVPVFQKCFCFIPLRQGLLAWGCFNAQAVMTILVFSVINMTEKMTYPSPYYGYYATMFVILLIVQIANMIYSIILIIASYKKSVKLLQEYYWFALGKILVSITALTVISIHTARVDPLWYYYSMDKFWFYLLVDNPASEVIHIIVQLYFLLLVRSELLHMKNGHVPTVYQNNLYFESEEKNLMPEYKIIDQDFANSLTAVITKILMQKEQEKKADNILNILEPTPV